MLKGFKKRPQLLLVARLKIKLVIFVLLFLVSVSWLSENAKAARLWSSGFELNSLTNGVEFSSNAGTLVIATSPIRSGTYALKAIPVLSTSVYVQNTILAADSGSGTNIFSRGYLRIATLPDAEMGIMSLDGTGFAFITLNSDGTLKLKNESNQTIGTSSALSTNTWYRIEMEVEFVTGASNDTVRARIDGATPFAETTAGTLSGGVRTATWGSGIYVANANSGEVNWDDLAVNDDTGSNQSNFPGEGKILNFKPNANGDFAMGSGTGCTDDDCVDETTPDDATTYYVLDVNNDKLDVNIEATSLSSKSIGTSDIIKAIQVGARHRGATTTARAHNLYIKSQSLGITASGSSQSLVNTTWLTHGDGDPMSYTLTSYTDPQAGGSWSASLIDSALIGVKCTDAAPDCWISTLWALVDYQPVLASQSAYRFFNNDASSTNVGTPLAAQDTSATLGAAGDAFRLRALIHISGVNLPINGEIYKLQFATKSGTCDTGFVGETYADVTAATAIAYNNNTPADGDNLTVNGNDPTHNGHTIVNQDYEELNNFTNSVAAIDGRLGQDGKWDFALKDNSAPAGASYCFRIVKATNSKLLDAYKVIPEITTAAAGDSMTFTIDAGSTINFGTIGISERIAAAPCTNKCTTRLKINTNSADGWSVTAGKDHVGVGALFSIDTTTINDTATGINQLSDGVPSPCNTETWPASLDVSSGLGFTVWASDAKDTSCWGTGTTSNDSLNQYAAFPDSVSAVKIVRDTDNSPNPSYHSVGYSLEVLNNQKSTTYDGDIIYSATATP